MHKAQEKKNNNKLINKKNNVMQFNAGRGEKMMQTICDNMGIFQFTITHDRTLVLCT